MDFQSKNHLFFIIYCPFFAKGHSYPVTGLKSLFASLTINRLAHENNTFNLFKFLAKPLYRTLRKWNMSLIYLNACSTLQRTEDLRFSIYRSQSIALSETLERLFGRRFMRKSMFLKCSLFFISSRFSIPIYPESPYTNSSSS